MDESGQTHAPFAIPKRKYLQATYGEGGNHSLFGYIDDENNLKTLHGIEFPIFD